MPEDKDYSLMTDGETAVLARTGDIAALEYIMGKYKPLVKLKSRQYYITGADRDDLIQEGMIGLYKAVINYKPDKQPRFYFFAELCVARQIISAVKSAARKKHDPLNRYVSLSGGADSQSVPPYTDTPEDVIIGREERADFEGKMGQAMSQALSEFENRALIMHLRGHGYAEIAESLDCAPKSVDNALQRARRKLSGIAESKNR